MKTIKLIILYSVLISSICFSQSFKFGFVTDIHIGSNGSEELLKKIIIDINKKAEVKFVVFTGDISETGKPEQLESAKNIIKALKVPFYVIPGNHDTKWSPTGLSKFTELFKDTKFQFTYNNVKFIGMNSGILWRGGGGHFTEEDIKWLSKNVTQTNSSTPIIFFSHHQLDNEVDNSFKVLNIIGTNSTIATLCGHGHVNKHLNYSGIDGYMGLAGYNKNEENAGYNIVEVSKDSLKFFETTLGGRYNEWAAKAVNTTLNYKPIDSLQTNNSIFTNILFEKEFHYSLQSTPFVWDKQIYFALKNGDVYCLDFNGTVKWKTKVSGTILSTPKIIDSIVVVSSVDGDITTLDAISGKQIQTLGTGEYLTSQITEINYQGDKQIFFRKYKDRVPAFLIGTGKGEIQIYEVHNLQPLFNSQIANGMIESTPLLLNNKIYLGAWDNSLYCLDSKDGSLIWKWTDNNNFYFSPASCSPITDGNNIFISTPDKVVHCIDGNLGKTIWKNSQVNAWESVSLSETKDTLIVKSIDKTIYLLNKNKGSILSSFNIGFSTDTNPIQTTCINGNLLVPLKNGFIYNIKNDVANPIIFLGTCRAHTLMHLENNKFLGSNMDGKIVIFELK